MQKQITQEMLMNENNYDIRNSYINNLEVFEKVKALVLLGDKDLATTEMVANYFEVEEATIRQVLSRHNSEFYSDGAKTLKGRELAKLKTDLALQGVTLKARSNLAVFPKRAILRVGMLLTGSTIAEAIRTHLLNVYEKSSVVDQIKSIQEQFNMPVNMGDAYKLIGQLYDQLDGYKHKANTYDTIMHTQSTFSMKEVSDILSKAFKKKIGRNKLMEYLRTKGVIIKTGRTPAVKYLDNKKGLFVVDMEPVNGKTYAATKAYSKGIKFIYDMLTEDWDNDLATTLADGEVYIPKQFEGVLDIDSITA